MTIPAARAKIVAYYQFELTEDLALWLKGLMQNKIYDDESAEEEQNRIAIFTAVHNVEHHFGMKNGERYFNQPKRFQEPLEFNPDDEIPF